MTEADFEKMSAFSCGVKELDDFFHFEVKECVRYHYLTAYAVVVDPDEIIAAFTLMNDALMIKDHTEKEDFIEDLRYEAEGHIVDFFKNQTSYPAINIGHLGTSKEYQGMGIGTIIIDLVAETFSRYDRAGCQFITVDALNNERTTRFYCNNLFYFQTMRDHTSATRRMYRML